MYPTIVVFIYLVFCVLLGFAADRMMYRSFWGWTLLAFLFSPLVAIIFLQVAGPPLRVVKQVRQDEEAHRRRTIVDDELRADDAKA